MTGNTHSTQSFNMGKGFWKNPIISTQEGAKSLTDIREILSRSLISYSVQLLEISTEKRPLPNFNCTPVDGR